MKKLFKKSKLISVIVLMVSMSFTFQIFAQATGENAVEPQNFYHYGFEDGYLLGVKPGTIRGQFTARLLEQDSITSVTVYNTAGQIASVLTDIGTGMTALINNEYLFTIVVYGDLNADGLVDVSDTTVLSASISGSGVALTGAARIAGDLNSDGNITSADVTLLTTYITNSGHGTMTAIGIRKYNEDKELLENSHPSHTTYIDTVCEYMINAGYSQTQRMMDATIANTLDAMQNSSVFAIRCEGNYDRLAVYDASKSYCEIHLKVDDDENDDINGLPANALSDLRLALLCACLTGADTANTNITTAVYQKGAQAVIGFKKKINCSKATLWTEQFFLSLSKGVTIQRAMDEADYVLLSNYPTAPGNVIYRLCLGNMEQRLSQFPAITFDADTFSDYVSSLETNSLETELNTVDYISDNIQGNVQGYLLEEDVYEEISTNNVEINVNQRLSIAVNELSEYINDIQNYTFDDETYIDSTNKYVHKCYRYINGIRTSDYGVVIMDECGNVLGVSTKNTQLFDEVTIPTSLTNDSIISNIYSTLQEEYGSDNTFSIDNYTLNLNEANELFIEASVEISNNDVQLLETIEIMCN